jgi:hypothetical protein
MGYKQFSITIVMATGSDTAKEDRRYLGRKRCQIAALYS